MSLTITGMDSLQRSLDSRLKRLEQKVVEVRKLIAMDLVDALLSNIPVWSGKTVRSVSVSNSDSGSNTREPHPDRRDFAKDGPWESHKKDFGDTRHMSLGEEPKRSSSEAIAKASAAIADYGIANKVFVVSNSYIWGEIDTASYRPDARNRAVVSDIALAMIRSKYKGTVR